MQELLDYSCLTMTAIRTRSPVTKGANSSFVCPALHLFLSAVATVLQTLSITGRIKEMNRNWVVVCLITFVSIGLLSCSGGKKTTAPAPQAGRITARVESIPGQSGNVCAIMAYAVDWQPGAVEPPVAALVAPITAESFSFGGALEARDVNGQTTGQAKMFDPGVYSVVFFVAVPGSPPSIFAEVRASVDGDITVTAPAWANWQHP
jgi:hypothetical protein